MPDANQVCITTRCRTVDEFIATFRRYVEVDSIFVAEIGARTPGVETAFVVVLADGRPMLRGRGVVKSTWASPDNPFRTPGFVLGILELTPRSRDLFERMLRTRTCDETLQSVSPPLPPRTPAVDAPADEPTIDPPCPRVSTATMRQYFAPAARPPSPSELEAVAADSFSAPTRVNKLQTHLHDLDPAAPSAPSAPSRRARVAWAFSASLLVAFAIAGAVRASSDDASPLASAGPAAVSAPVQDTSPVVGEGPCRVSVHAIPAGASVALDGVARGPAPVTIATACGQHRLDVSHPTHRPLTALTALQPGSPEVLEVTLSRPIHAVWVTTVPEGATIYIDGQPVGETPRRLNVIGHVPLALELRKPGYRSVTEHVLSTVERDRLAVRLTPVSAARPRRGLRR